MGQSRSRRLVREEIRTVAPSVLHDLIRQHLHTRLRGAALRLAGELIRREVEGLCGAPWSRKEATEPRRGGSETGRIYVAGQQAAVRRPRVRQSGREVELQTYAALGDFDVLGEEIERKMVRGVSTREYGEVIDDIAGGLGLPRSRVSEAFVRASQKALDEINGRDLGQEQIVALFIDALEFGGTWVVVAMGVTTTGQKRFLGLQEGHSENAVVVGALLDNLVGRGLALTDDFLAVLDGSKALRAAILKRWEGRVRIQRCQVHKKRNVLEQLPKTWHAEVKRRMNAAYGMKSYAEAEKALRSVATWLRGISEPAAASLEEGLEETLTVVRLGLSDLLRRTFSTTNPLESVFQSVRSRTGRVKRWRSGSHRMIGRWVASALLVIEKRLHKIRGHAQISILIHALKQSKLDILKEVG